jgi:hypothetical protein
MITGFETINLDLTEDELALIPIFINGFKKRGPAILILFVRNTVFLTLIYCTIKLITDMNEARISYLCTHAARHRLTLDELSELLGYIVLDPKLLDMIWIESIIKISW